MRVAAVVMSSVLVPPPLFHLFTCSTTKDLIGKGVGSSGTS